MRTERSSKCADEVRPGHTINVDPTWLDFDIMMLNEQGVFHRMWINSWCILVVWKKRGEIS